MKDMPATPKVITSSLESEFVKEVKTPCTLVQKKVGDKIESHLEVCSYKNGKETIRKIPIKGRKKGE